MTSNNTTKILYAIILNWNNYRDTRESIRSLLASSLIPDGIIVIDNDSRDGSGDMLQSDFKKIPIIRIIKNRRNIGFAAGVNVGIRLALKEKADLIFLLNNDAVVEGDCLIGLKNEMLEEARTGIAGPRIFYSHDPERIWHGGGRFNHLLSGVVIKEKNKKEGWHGSEIGDVSFLTACAMMIHKSVFEAIGLFDDNYFFYAEDLDFCIRARRAGFKLKYASLAKTWHKIGPINQQRVSPFVFFQIARSRMIFLRKNFKAPYLIYGYLIHFFLYTPFRIYQVLSGHGSWQAIFSWFYGTEKGMIAPIHSTPRIDYGKKY